MSKILFQFSSPRRAISVSLSEDDTTLSVVMVGSPLAFDGGELPPGYWEFTGEQAEQLLEHCKEWDCVGLLARVWMFGESEVFEKFALISTLPDVPEDTADTQSGPVLMHTPPHVRAAEERSGQSLGSEPVCLAGATPRHPGSCQAVDRLNTEKYAGQGN